MNNEITKIALGGGCHWCTEAVFQSLRGVLQVEQGYVASQAPNDVFSEAVIVHFDKTIIPTEILIEIHLLTHKSTKMHSMRETYRSAVYVYNEAQHAFAKSVLANFQKESVDSIVTEVLPFKAFRSSREQITNYYQKDPNKPFCVRYIAPKLELLKDRFAKRVLND